MEKWLTLRYKIRETFMIFTVVKSLLRFPSWCSFIWKTVGNCVRKMVKLLNSNILSIAPIQQLKGISIYICAHVCLISILHAWFIRSLLIFWIYRFSTAYANSKMWLKVVSRALVSERGGTINVGTWEKWIFFGARVSK